jgi:hypothetical protein
MKVTLLYTKANARGMRLMVSFGEGNPTPRDLVENYAIVYQNDTFPEQCSPDGIFAIFNGADSERPNPLSTEEGQKRIIEQGVAHTSMSVGDIVQIEDVSYLCQPTGWAVMKWEER